MQETFLHRLYAQQQQQTQEEEQKPKAEEEDDNNNNNSSQKSILQEFMSPFQGPDIPKQYKAEIIQAEANTVAAQERNRRILLYTTICVFTFLFGSMNAFLGLIRSTGTSIDDTDTLVLHNLHMDWIRTSANPILQFLLLNKFGGALALISTGIFGTFIEIENRSKTENAERIWKELQSRKRNVSSATATKRSNNNNNNNNNMDFKTSKVIMAKKNKKQQKRLQAFAEVIVSNSTPTLNTNHENNNTNSNNNNNNKNTLRETLQVQSPQAQEIQEKGVDKGGKNVLSQIKQWYEEADQMAASQAILLNKELEDRGILEKITDETGLKVVGKKFQNKE